MRKAKVAVMSFNLRVDMAVDAPHSWQNRLPIISNIILKNADIVGVQELLGKQYDDLKNNFYVYECVGAVKTSSGCKSEYNSILFAPQKFELLNKGTFWLSETPDSIGGIAWDAGYERSVNWAKLKDKKSKKIFFFFNTHFDDAGEIAQRESAKLLLKKVEEIAKSSPAIITGDFNADENSEAIKILTNKNNPQHFVDARSISKRSFGANYTFHAFGKIPENKRSTIDFIFVKNGVTVEETEVLCDCVNEIYPSDHCAVVAKISF